MEQRESYLHITSKMSFRDRNFVYFKAHFQTMLVLQQGNVSKILGPVICKFGSCLAFNDLRV